MKTNLLLMALVAVFSSTLSGQGFTKLDSKIQFKAALKKASDKVSTVTANFNQTKYLSFME